MRIREKALIALAAAILAALIPLTTQAQGPPEIPLGLTAGVSQQQTALKWNNPRDSSITHHRVYRRTVGVHPIGEFQTHEPDTGSPETMYTDQRTEPGRVYVYRVTAVNTAGESPRSGYIRVNTRVTKVPESWRGTLPPKNVVTGGTSIRLAPFTGTRPTRYPDATNIRPALVDWPAWTRTWSGSWQAVPGEARLDPAKTGSPPKVGPPCFGIIPHHWITRWIQELRNVGVPREQVVRKARITDWR